MAEGGARRTRNSRSSLATCEFEASPRFEALSQKAEKVGGVGGWEEEEGGNERGRTSLRGPGRFFLFYQVLAPPTLPCAPTET